MSTFDPAANLTAPAPRLSAAAVLSILSANPFQEGITLKDLLRWSRQGMFPRQRKEMSKKIPPTWDAEEVETWIDENFSSKPAEHAPMKSVLNLHLRLLRDFVV